MDFLQFLENSKNLKESKKQNLELNSDTSDNVDKKFKKSKDSSINNSNIKSSNNSNSNKNNSVSSKGTSEEKHVGYQNIRKGECVKIIYVANSEFNCYKGYIAEIREYTRGCDYAFICLPAKNKQDKFKIPIAHFQKM